MSVRFMVGALVFSSIFAVSSCAEPPGGNSHSSMLMRKLSLEELVEYSDWVVTGVITKSKSSWNAERTNIFTHHTISVEEWFRGGNGKEELVIVTAGGKVGFTTQWVENAARFQKGEKVLVFLSRNDDGSGEVVGGFQGKYTIEGENNTSVKDLICRIKALDN